VEKDKVMLVLLDSGSSHNFISSNFVKLAKLPTVPTQLRKIKLANGEWLTTQARVPNLQWYIQGHTLTSDMAPYDAIIGYDWLKKNSPMKFDWNEKQLNSVYRGRQTGLTFTTLTNKHLFQQNKFIIQPKEMILGLMSF
jgi:hypothetical protein